MIPLEQAISEVCSNCDRQDTSDCSMKYDFPSRCQKITQVLIDYNLKARDYERGVRVWKIKKIS